MKNGLILTALLLLPGSLLAAPPTFVDVPALDGAAQKGLRLRIVTYDGGTNGGMVVDVTNTVETPRRFEAEGLFFVPEMKPEDAPQRLGAAGPMAREEDGEWKSQDDLTLAPGETARVRLSVFCIDSHRSSPSAETPFRLAKKRLPPKLRQGIESGTKQILKEKKAGRAEAPAAKDDVQRHVWETRNKDWVPLEGEREDERAPQKNFQQRRHQPQQRSTP